VPGYFDPGDVMQQIIEALDDRQGIVGDKHFHLSSPRGTPVHP
jgi:hypothetical protein